MIRNGIREIPINSTTVDDKSDKSLMPWLENVNRDYISIWRSPFKTEECC